MSDEKDGGDEVDQEDTDDFVAKKYVYFWNAEGSRIPFQEIIWPMLANVNSRVDGVMKGLTEWKSSLQFLQKDIDDRKEQFLMQVTQHF